jgi:tetratricopeptide (TPR) repeat protein
MRVCIGCFALILVAGQSLRLLGEPAAAQQKTAEPAKPAAIPGGPPASATEPLSDEDKANQLSDQVGKLMVKCVNLLTAQDPLSLDYCKQQRDLADQYPPRQRMVDKMMAHDEYGIALAAFDHKHEALAEFDEEVALAPKAVKPGSPEWSTAYWHRAMIYNQLGETDKADRDYRAAEENFRKVSSSASDESTEKKRRIILRQHAALLQKEGKTEAAHQLLQEAAK